MGVGRGVSWRPWTNLPRHHHQRASWWNDNGTRQSLIHDNDDSYEYLYDIYGAWALELLAWMVIFSRVIPFIYAFFLYGATP
jgi:hypothetical protein